MMRISSFLLPKLQRHVPGDAVSKTMKKQQTILIIDDDDIFIYLTSKVLQGTGKVNTIEVRYSASEALLHLENGHTDKNLPDIILLDLNMPGMTGWEFLSRYQEMAPHFYQFPKLFVVSSSIAENDKQRALNMSCVSGYIAKPVTADSLRQVLE